MTASPWAGLVAAPKPRPKAPPRKIAPKDPISPRVAKLEKLLQEKGPMNSDALRAALGWSAAQLQTAIFHTPRVRNVGRAVLLATVKRVAASVHLAKEAQAPTDPRLRTAKAIYALLLDRKSVPFLELDATLGLNHNTLRNTIYRHPELFAVVRSHSMLRTKVSRAVYEYEASVTSAGEPPA